MRVRLAETVFVLPATDPAATYRARIFTPEGELPFAGHPSVGAAVTSMRRGRFGPGPVVQECGAGLLPIHVEDRESGRRIFFRTPPTHGIRVANPDEPGLSAALDGVALGALPPAQVDAGRRWWLAELADEATLRGLRPDLDLDRAW